MSRLVRRSMHKRWLLRKSSPAMAAIGPCPPTSGIHVSSATMTTSFVSNVSRAQWERELNKMIGWGARHT